MDVPDHLSYTQDHEWVQFDADGRTAKMGITDFAQKALGDVVFVQAPQVGTRAQLGMTFGEVESSKSVSDIYAPVTGVVLAVNEDLADSPQRLNEDPYTKGWICVIELTADATTDHLLSSTDYKALVEG